MENSQNTKLPQEPSQQSDSVIDMPDEWREIAFQDFFANGWKPRIKTTRGIAYITLRHGNNEKSLGVHNEDRWRLITSMLPKQVLPPPTSRGKGQQLSLLGATMKKADWVPKSFTPTIDTLKWFESLKEVGSPVSFDEFVNDIIYVHFKICHRAKIGIIMEQPQR